MERFCRRITAFVDWHRKSDTILKYPQMFRKYWYIVVIERYLLNAILLWVKASWKWWWIVLDKKQSRTLCCTAFIKWVVTYTACPLRKLTWIVNLFDSRCKDRDFLCNLQIFNRKLLFIPNFFVTLQMQSERETI